MIYFESEYAFVRDSRKTDINKLAKNVKEEDKIEIWNSHHQTPKGALQNGFDNSVLCLSIVYEKRIIAMFGVIPQSILGKTATIWFLSSKEIEKIQWVFAKQTRYFIDLFLSYFSVLENYVGCDSEKALKWLKFSKAEFRAEAPYGVEGKMFKYFKFVRNNA